MSRIVYRCKLSQRPSLPSIIISPCYTWCASAFALLGSSPFVPHWNGKLKLCCYSFDSKLIKSYLISLLISLVRKIIYPESPKLHDYTMLTFSSSATRQHVHDPISSFFLTASTSSCLGDIIYLSSPVFHRPSIRAHRRWLYTAGSIPLSAQPPTPSATQIRRSA